MESSGFIRKGYLLKCPQKALNPFKQKWQSRWFALYGNSQQGRVRLEYHDNEKAWQQEKGKRVIPLSNCVSIKPVRAKEYNHVIEIVIQDKTIHLAATSKDEEKSWFKDLCQAVFGNSNRNSIVQVVEKPALELDFGYHSLDRSVVDSIGDTESPRPLHTVEESLNESSSREELRSISASSGALNDNHSTDGIHGSHGKLQKTLTSSVASELSSLVSFESGFDDGSSMASTITDASSYPVTIRPTIASQKAGMSGTYLLQINTLTLSLIDIPSQSIVCEWPIQYLRRYGRGRTKFSFEASEKCKNGKGVYTFNTLEGDAIFHSVDMHARGISMRNQMLRKRTSVPDGFKPLGAATKKLHHSDGRLSEKYSDIGTSSQTNTNRFSDSTNDILTVNPSDSVSQIGTLPKHSNTKNKTFEGSDHVSTRGMSIGSGISLEIAQNISQTVDESKGSTSVNLDNDSRICIPECRRQDLLIDSSLEEESLVEEAVRPTKHEVSVIEEETLAQTLETEQVMDKKNRVIEESKSVSCSKSNLQPLTSEENNHTKKVKRSSSLKLPSALKKSNSNTKDMSLKKSQSVKRSSSFRSRFFKYKFTDEDKSSKSERKLKSKSSQDLNTHPEENMKDLEKENKINHELNHHDQQKIVKELLAKAIEDEMSKSSETETSATAGKTEQKQKRRRYPLRHKSNEMLGNGTPEKGKGLDRSRLSSSFAGYDYKGQVAYSRNDVDDEDVDELRWLQRRTQSVMKKVELYENIKKQADERCYNSYTVWRKKQNAKDSKLKSIDIPDSSDV